MLELKNNQLVFSFPEVHPDARLVVTLHRTFRIPDDAERRGTIVALLTQGLAVKKKGRRAWATWQWLQVEEESAKGCESLSG